MGIFFQIALRNIRRHRRRSLITLSAISFGLGAIIFLWSFTDGAHRQMILNITRAHTSDAQILPQALDYVYDTTATIDHPEEIIKILKKDPSIQAYALRVIGGAMVSTANSSMATYAIGIDNAEEDGLGSRREKVRGEAPAPGQENWVVMGERMRKILNVEIGDKVVLTVQDLYGSLNGEAFKLAATFETGNDQIDNQSVLISRKDAQRLFSLGDKVSRIALKVAPGFETRQVVGRIKDKLKGTSLSIQTWEELLPMIAQMIHFNNQTIFFVMVIVLSVVALGILNTMMMSIVERTHEFGLMMALGTKPHQVVRLVIFETLLLSLIGSFLGILLGVSITLYFSHFGIDLSQYMRSLGNLLIGPRVYPHLQIKHLFISFGVVFLSTFLVSLYPANRASRLEPVEAMRKLG